MLYNRTTIFILQILFFLLAGFIFYFFAFHVKVDSSEDVSSDPEKCLDSISPSNFISRI